MASATAAYREGSSQKWGSLPEWPCVVVLRVGLARVPGLLGEGESQLGRVGDVEDLRRVDEPHGLVDGRLEPVGVDDESRLGHAADVLRRELEVVRLGAGLGQAP